MADFNVLIPKLGESVQEGTITKIFVKQGDIVAEDDILFEIATDKVDSEIPSPVAGRINKIQCAENETYPVGEVIMVISIGEVKSAKPAADETIKSEKKSQQDPDKEIVTHIETSEQIEPHEPEIADSQPLKKEKHDQDHFYSPLVKNIAAKEGISLNELSTITGSGLGGRVQKKDISAYVEQRKQEKKEDSSQSSASENDHNAPAFKQENPKVSISIGADDTIVKMDRIRKLIANHMVMSKQVSPHVTTVVEADVTNVVLWRNRMKEHYLENHAEKLTYMPIFTEAVAKALSEYMRINVSVDGDNIILHKHINIGIAVARNDGNLIVPVIIDADTKNLLGLTKEINSLSDAARDNKLNPDQLQGGTFTITNFGSFGNLMGTPIINQPQAAILAVGLIEKKPAVIETDTGDAIVVRHKMFLSLSYDHRVIDGMLGGKFLRRIADLLEQFDIKREI